MGGLAFDRDVGVFGHVERGETVLVGQLGRRRRSDATIKVNNTKSKVHTEN